ncbi:uncharacterized protein LOC131860330 [Cryptomeria japonica]|uniref:uncharacterized protein LOC131860330 n=1 Tax=Cryptomeria japonica TaxID=3369 RepID=UPI0027DA6A54|nr:uncharacterized protein LOC131860330 [Cryptomeria japonica]
MNAKECMDWVEALENYFECDDTPESSKVKIAKSKMKGLALSWWNFLQNERVENNKVPITTWKKMLAEVKKQFVPEDYEVTLHKKLHNLKQKDMDVSTYTEEFYKLSLKTKISETENQKLARYVNGLKYSIQDELSLFNLESVHKCHQMVLKIEEKQKKRGEQNNRGGRGNPNFRGRGRFHGRGSFQKQQGESSHQDIEKDSGYRSNPRGGRGTRRGRFGGRGSNVFTGRCFSCNQVGHQSFRCPEKASNSSSQQGERRVQLAQEDDHQSTTSYLAASSRLADPVIGECIMFNRSLLTPISKEPPQRKSLFWTTCLVNGKVCKVIVDSGSTENLVSTEMIEKLGLKKIPHPNPYKVSWLNKEQQTIVDEQCWISFAIGEYEDKVLCEVVHMDACHLLLGRPWQYDTSAQHDGKKNVYHIKKNGDSFTMTPLPDEPKEKTSTNSVMLVGEKEFMRGLKEEKTLCFAVVVKPKDNRPKEEKIQNFAKDVGPKEVADLLNQYKGIVADGINDTLPPERLVSHCIDLIPGATLPNKAAYKLTPKQNAEVSRQIQELLEKGFIRKSISPYAIPAILAPKKEGT